MIGAGCDSRHFGLSVPLVLGLSVGVWAVSVLAQPTADAGPQAGETETIRQVGTGVLRARQAYRTEHEQAVAELRDEVVRLRSALTLLAAATAAPQLERTTPFSDDMAAMSTSLRC